MYLQETDPRGRRSDCRCWDKERCSAGPHHNTRYHLRLEIIIHVQVQPPNQISEMMRSCLFSSVFQRPRTVKEGLHLRNHYRSLKFCRLGRCIVACALSTTMIPKKRWRSLQGLAVKESEFSGLACKFGLLEFRLRIPPASGAEARQRRIAR